MRDANDRSERARAEPITSLTNPRVKAAVRLRDRRERDATGLTIVDGAREILRALDAGVRVETAFIAPDVIRHRGRDRRRRAAPSSLDDRRGQCRGPRQGCVRRSFRWRRGDRGDAASRAGRPRPADRSDRRRGRGRREAGQPGRRPALGGWGGRRCRDRSGSADGPVQSERHPGLARNDLRRARRRRPRRR